MTHRPDYTLSEELLEHLTEEGLDALPEMIRIVINSAMQAERLKYLGVDAPYERSSERADQANGYKPKSVKTRAGEITFAVPQLQGIPRAKTRISHFAALAPLTPALAA